MHLIVEAADKRGLWRGMTGLEVRITRAINKVLGRKGRLWTDRYHRHDLRTPSKTRNALRYVLLNLQKHHRIIGDRAFADPHSSAATFDGFTRPPWLVDEDLRWPRVAPRTWLLGVGWRRRGLIDPADGPRGAKKQASSGHRARHAYPLVGGVGPARLADAAVEALLSAAEHSPHSFARARAHR